MEKSKLKTSLLAFREQLYSGNFKTNALRVANELRIGGPKTKKELMAALSMSHPTVTSILSSLKDLGMVTEGKIVDNCRANHYEPDPVKQLENALKRREEMFKKWVVQGLRRFPDEVSQLETLKP